MQLVETVGRAAAAFDEQGRFAQMPDEVVELGDDVARIEIDQNRLHLQDVGGLGLAGLRNRSRHHIEGSALSCRPAGKGDGFFQQAVVDLDPGIVGTTVNPLALVDETAQRHPAIAIGEDDVEKDGDLLGIRLDVEGIGLGFGVVEITPRVEGDDVVLAHAGSPQQRSAHGHMRHSWKSRVVAIRGSNSPASVACRIRTPRSLIR